ncbi:LTA synthase family protein [Streptococcus suis]
MIERLKQINIDANLHYLVLFLVTFCLNYFITNVQLLSGVSLNSEFQSLQTFLFFLSIFSVVILSFYIYRDLNKLYLQKLRISYFIYLLISYLLLITRNLNNENFKPYDIIGNQFFEIQGLCIVAIILLMGYSIQKLSNKYPIIRRLDSSLQEYQGKDYSLALLMTILTISDSKIIAILNESLQGIVETQNFYSYVSYLSSRLFIFTLFVTIVTITGLKSIIDITNNKSSFSLAFSTSLILSLVFNYFFQLGVRGDSELLGHYIFPGATLYQLLFLTVVNLVLYLLINRYVVTTVLLIMLGTFITIINNIKVSMRSEPLLVTDLIWLKELNTVTSFVSQFYVFLAILIIGLGIFLIIYLNKRIFVGQIIKFWKVRFSMLGVVFLMSTFVLQVFTNEENARVVSGIPILSRVNNWYDITWFGFEANARYKSLSYVWTKQLTKPIMVKPKNYSKKAIEELIDKYSKRAEEINKARKNQIADQTIIYVLSESFSDPERVDGVSINKDILENIKKIKSGTSSGLMRSDGYGGGTANMEFQALTGLPYYNYSSTVSVIYTEVVPKMSIFPSISEQFESENRIVMHPSGANNYSRKTIYEDLGFSKLIFNTDSNEKFSNPEKTGVSISDETVYRNILENINEQESQFFSVITMQNHSPWSVGQPSDIVASGTNFSDQQNGALTEYSRLLSYTDAATEKFLKELSKIKKDITVVFYGDHLPGLYPDKAFEDNPESQYQTDYFIWSNHTSKKQNYPLVNSSDFIAELFAHTDSKVSPYYALLTDILIQASIDKEEFTEEQQQIADDLKLLQYDITIGKGYIKSSPEFFEIEK